MQSGDQWSLNANVFALHPDFQDQAFVGHIQQGVQNDWELLQQKLLKVSPSSDLLELRTALMKYDRVIWHLYQQESSLGRQDFDTFGITMKSFTSFLTGSGIAQAHGFKDTVPFQACFSRAREVPKELAKDAKASCQDGIVRWQFLEALIHIAERCKSEEESHAGAVTRIMGNFIEPMARTIIGDIKTFRSMLFTRAIEDVFRDTSAELLDIFRCFSKPKAVGEVDERGIDCNTMNLHEWMTFGWELGIFDVDSLQECSAPMSFIIGAAVYANDVTYTRHLRLSFVEFLQAIGWACFFRIKDTSDVVLENFADALKDCLHGSVRAFHLRVFTWNSITSNSLKQKEQTTRRLKGLCSSSGLSKTSAQEIPDPAKQSLEYDKSTAPDVCEAYVVEIPTHGLKPPHDQSADIFGSVAQLFEILGLGIKQEGNIIRVQKIINRSRAGILNRTINTHFQGHRVVVGDTLDGISCGMQFFAVEQGVEAMIEPLWQAIEQASVVTCSLRQSGQDADLLELRRNIQLGQFKICFQFHSALSLDSIEASESQRADKQLLDEDWTDEEELLLLSTANSQGSEQLSFEKLMLRFNEKCGTRKLSSIDSSAIRRRLRQLRRSTQGWYPLPEETGSIRIARLSESDDGLSAPAQLDAGDDVGSLVLASDYDSDAILSSGVLDWTSRLQFSADVAKWQLADKWLHESMSSQASDLLEHEWDARVSDCWTRQNGVFSLQIEVHVKDSTGEDVAYNVFAKVQPQRIKYCCCVGQQLSQEDSKGCLQSGVVAALRADGCYDFRLDGSAEFCRVDPGAQNVIVAATFRYPCGQQFPVMQRDSTLANAVVEQWLGVAHGNRHKLRIGSSIVELDLNHKNHFPYFSTAEEYVEASRAFCKHVEHCGSHVEDAITGEKLRTKDQVLNIETTVISGELPASMYEVDNIACLAPHFLRLEHASPLHAHHSGKLSSVLLRANPGTGKTWSLLQLQYFLAEQYVENRPGSKTSKASTIKARGRIPISRVPLLISVQELARLMLKWRTDGLLVDLVVDATQQSPGLIVDVDQMDRNCIRIQKIVPGGLIDKAIISDARPCINVGSQIKMVNGKTTSTSMLKELSKRQNLKIRLRVDHKDLVVSFIHEQYRSSDCKSQTMRRCLMQAYASRDLILLFDGIDEASSLKEIVEDYIIERLFPLGFHAVVSSRPEGVRDSLYGSFIIFDLKPLSDAQMKTMVHAQLQDDPFYKHLLAFSEIRQRHDFLYTTLVIPSEPERLQIESFVIPDRFRLNVKGRTLFDPNMRQKTRDGARFVAQRASLQSRYLIKLSQDMKLDDCLGKLDVALAPGPSGVDRQALAQNVKRMAPIQKHLHSILERLALVVLKYWGTSATGALAAASIRDAVASTLWRRITERTDEIFEVAEELHPIFQKAMEGLLFMVGKPDCRLVVADLKDPVRVYEKAKDEYDARFRDGVPAESCVADILRARAIFTDGSAMVKMLKLLTSPDGLTVRLESGTVVLECLKMNNKFANTDPSHFRSCLCNLRLTWHGVSAKCELQVHHAQLYDHSEESNAPEHYAFFRSALQASCDAVLDVMLERMLVLVDEAQGVPILLGLLIVALKGHRDKKCDMPDSILSLYQTAQTEILRHQAPVSDLDVVRNSLEQVASVNMIQQRRAFTSDDVAEALADSKVGRKFVKRLRQEISHAGSWHAMDDSGAIPMVKILNKSDGENPAEYQFKHLSFQEALWVVCLINGHVPDNIWGSDASSANYLNNPFYLNSSRMGAGSLADRFAKVRPTWNFLHNRLNPKGLEALSCLLGNHPRMRTRVLSIILNDNELRDEGAAWLGRALKAQTGVRTLKLRSNEIGDHGASALASGLAGNLILSSLDLGDNTIAATGVIALAAAIKVNSALANFQLDGNLAQAGKFGLMEMSDALLHNRSLRTLNLARITICSEEILALTEALCMNSSLTHLSVDLRVHSPRVVRAMDEAFLKSGIKELRDGGADVWKKATVGRWVANNDVFSNENKLVTCAVR